MKIVSTLLFIALIGFASCKKKSTTDPEPPLVVNPGPSTPSIDVNSAVQVSYTLDGTAVSYVTDGTHYFGGVASSGNTNWTYSSGIDDGDTTSYFYITKGTMHTAGGSPTDSAFRAFYPVAAVPYSVNAVNGVEIEIWDSNHQHWSTSLGSGSQPGFSFNIVQTKDEQQGYLYVKTYITFSCRVYNAAGAFKTITNGKYVGHFGNI